MSVCIYGVCAGLAKPGKCFKGQKRFECKKRAWEKCSVGDSDQFLTGRPKDKVDCLECCEL